MRSRTGLLACGLVLLGLLLSSGAALADGGGGSAGNSQYVDPLSGQSHSGHPKSHGSTSAQSSTTATSTATTSTTSSSSTLSQSAPSSVASSSAPAPKSGKTLPFTGLDLWACIGLGLGMLGAGLALRRVLARVY